MLLYSLMSESGATWIEHRVLNGRPADVHELRVGELPEHGDLVRMGDDPLERQS